MTAEKALEVLVFWANCFDSANYNSPNALYGGKKGCQEAEEVLEDMIEQSKSARPVQP